MTVFCLIYRIKTVKAGGDCSDMPEEPREAWVKDGYIEVVKVPKKKEPATKIMKQKARHKGRRGGS